RRGILPVFPTRRPSGRDGTLVFLRTGTGEAPQNAMTAQLLRRGHQGRILNVVCVRYLRDLGYAHIHPEVAAKWPNFRYHLFATRDRKSTRLNSSHVKIS